MLSIIEIFTFFVSDHLNPDVIENLKIRSSVLRFRDFSHSEDLGFRRHTSKFIPPTSDIPDFLLGPRDL